MLCILLHLSLTFDFMWLKQTFTEADKNGDGSLSISEVLQLLHKLNVNLPRQKVKQMFKVPKPLHRLSFTETMALIYQPYVRQKTARGHFPARLDIFQSGCDRTIS